MKIFRPANEASFAWNYFKTLSQTVVFWSVFLFLLPWLILKFQRAAGVTGFEPQPALGAVLFIVGGLLGLWSGFVMTRSGHGTPLPTDCPSRLVIDGPYAFVRNPMAVAGIWQGVAVGIFAGSWLVILYSLLGIPVWHLLARPSEEADMRERFGGEFDSYCAGVALWIPRLVPYRAVSNTDSAGDKDTLDGNE